MPLPIPHSGEAQSHYISRCIAFETKASPGRDPKQIQAICYTAWRNRNVKQALGEGRGQDGPRQGIGGAKYCKCVKCGYWMEHNRNTPCQEIKCPKCGSPMTGINIKPTGIKQDTKMNSEKLDITNVTIVDLKAAKVDVENNIIHRMSIMSRKAVDTAGKVFREFSDNALQDALTVFNGAIARIDHDRDASEGGGRGVKTGYGVYKDLVMDGDMIFGDLHLWDCPEAKKVLSIAQRTPNVVGNSIHTGGIVSSRDNGIEHIEKLLSRNAAGHLPSIDLVDDPAATLGLFNSKHSVDNEKENSMEFKDLTLETVRINRPDLEKIFFDEGVKSRDEEVKKIQQERDDVAKKCDELEVKQAAVKHNSLVDKLLGESELPDYAKTSVFRKQLSQVKETKDGDKVVSAEDAIKVLIQDRLDSLEPHGVEDNGEKDTRQSKGKESNDDEFVSAFSAHNSEY